MENREKTCCFTGHRVLSGEEEARLAVRLRETLTELIGQGVSRFVSGGALGFDQLAARVVLGLMREHPQIRLIMMLPCRSQAEKWTPRQAALYGEILSHSSEVHYVCDNYTSGCMFMRNRAMVDMSGVCVSFQKRERGGTAYTVSYARRQGVQVINLL